jgi:uncharacterized protein involved in exopolysaccharide biosynthesis
MLLHGLFQRRKMIVGLTVTILATILLGTMLWPRSYEASSSVIVRGRNYQDPLFAEPRRGGQATLVINPIEEINSEIAIIRSRPVLVKVVESLRLHERVEIRDFGFLGAVRTAIRAGLKPLQGFMAKTGAQTGQPEQAVLEAAVTKLGEQLRVEPAIDSQIIRIIYRDPDPTIAAQVVNKIAEEYLQQHLIININKGESSFYEEQTKRVEGELAELFGQLERVKRTEGIVSFAEQSKMLLDKFNTFDVARSTIKKEIISRRSKVQGIQDLLKSNPEMLIPLPEIAQNPIIEDLENKLVNLRFQLEALRQRYTEDSRQVVTSKEQVDQVKAQIRNQVSLFLDREVADLRKLEAEERALSHTIKGLTTEMKALPAKELTLANLEKQIQDRQTTLTALRNKHQDAIVAQGTDFRLENAKIVSQASVPLKPVAPNLPLNLALGLILALVVSFSSAFFVEYWDDSLKVPEDVDRRLGLQVLASIPEL